MVIAAAHPDYSPHRLGRPLDIRDLVQRRQLVVRDSALCRAMDAGYLKPPPLGDNAADVQCSGPGEAAILVMTKASTSAIDPVICDEIERWG